MIRGSWRSWPTFAKRAPKFIPRVTPCNRKHPRRAAAGSTTGRAAKSTITVVVAKRPSCLNPRAYRLIQFLESLGKLFEKIVVKHITSGIGEFERTGHVVSGGRRKCINHLGPNLLTVVPSELDRSDLPKQNAMLLMEAPSSVIELLARQIWYRVRGMYSKGAPPETSTTPSSPAAKLPSEILEMIIGYLTYDMRCLRACTMTCHSWYIVAVPHLHRTFTIETHTFGHTSEWQKPLQSKHSLGLLPLVKRLRVRGFNKDYAGLSPTLFNSRTLNQFSTLTNVRELEVEYLDIPNFIPHVKRYFKHFLPTLTSLHLREPKGSDRQIVYFIGLFQHLQDLKLVDVVLYLSPWGKPADDLTLIPPFIPPLRGRLSMSHFTRVDLLKDMIDLFGGIRFHRMNLFDVDGMRILLGAGAETLETLLLDPADPRAGYSLRDFDLSQNKSLRRLAFLASNMIISPRTTSFFKHLVSTIAPSTSLEISLVHCECSFPGVQRWYSDSPRLSGAERELVGSHYHQIFEMLHEVYKVRSFQLVLRASVWGRVGYGEEPVRMLEEVIEEEQARGGFDEFPCEPLVTYNPREFHADHFLGF